MEKKQGESLQEREKRYWKRWHEHGDKARMIQLQKQDPSIATYSPWGTSIVDHTVRVPGRCLLGQYDVIFVDSFHYSCLPSSGICKSVAGGTLTLTSKQISVNGRKGQQEVVHGKISEILQSFSPESCCQHEVEEQMQLSDVEFTESINVNSIYWDSRHDENNLHAVRIGVIVDSIEKNWSPITHYNLRPGNNINSSDEYDNQYVDFMWKELNHRQLGVSTWKEESSWLCQYMGLPAETAKHIHSFNHHLLPAMTWRFQEGDIFVSMRHCHGPQHTSYRTEYVARPKSADQRKRIVQVTKNLLPVTDHTVERKRL